MHIVNKQLYIFLHQTLLDYESCSYWATSLFHAVKSQYKVRLDYCVPLRVSLLAFPPVHAEVTSKEFQLL